MGFEKRVQHVAFPGPNSLGYSHQMFWTSKPEVDESAQRRPYFLKDALHPRVSEGLLDALDEGRGQDAPKQQTRLGWEVLGPHVGLYQAGQFQADYLWQYRAQALCDPFSDAPTSASVNGKHDFATHRIQGCANKFVKVPSDRDGSPCGGVGNDAGKCASEHQLH